MFFFSYSMAVGSHLSINWYQLIWSFQQPTFKKFPKKNILYGEKACHTIFIYGNCMVSMFFEKIIKPVFFRYQSVQLFSKSRRNCLIFSFYSFWKMYENCMTSIFSILDIWNCMTRIFVVWNCMISIFGVWRSTRGIEHTLRWFLMILYKQCVMFIILSTKLTIHK